MKIKPRIVSTRYGIGRVTTFDSFSQTAIVLLDEETEDDNGHTVSRVLLMANELVDIEDGL